MTALETTDEPMPRRPARRLQKKIDRDALHRWLFRRADGRGRVRIVMADLAAELDLSYANLAAALAHFQREGRMKALQPPASGRPRLFWVEDPERWQTRVAELQEKGQAPETWWERRSRIQTERETLKKAGQPRGRGRPKKPHDNPERPPAFVQKRGVARPTAVNRPAPEDDSIRPYAWPTLPVRSQK